MNIKTPRLPPLEPYGRALLDFHQGKSDALLQVQHSLDGLTEISAKVFFRGGESFFDFEQAALDQCRGSVLDIGAGSGLHSLELQSRGFQVWALEIVPQAIQVMRERGVQRIVQEDVFVSALPPADTVILLMNGTGLAATRQGLKRLLQRLHGSVNTGGQILIDSADPGVEVINEEYPGEARIELAYEDQWGESYGELYCDLGIFEKIARSSGWNTQTVFLDGDGTFVSRLFR